MLLTIHNLPTNTQYNDVKELITQKCGLKESIVDNLVNEGSGMRVTVGVLEEEDAAMLVRKINGLYYRGQQLYVENKRQKRESEQPYRVNMAQPPFLPPQPSYDYSQMQAMSMLVPANQMAGLVYQAQPVTQAVLSASMAYGQPQYSDTVMSQYTGTVNEFSNQAYNQQAPDQQDYGASQSENLFARRPNAPVQDQARTDSRWDERRPQRDDLGQQRDDRRPQRDDRRPEKDDRHPQRDDRLPQRDDRRRPVSPSHSDWNQEFQPESKRPKWDATNDHLDRPDKSDRQGRFREERVYSNTHDDRFGERQNNRQSRWEQPRGEQPGYPDRRGSHSVHDRNESKPNWKTRQPQQPKFNQDSSMPSQSSPKYNNFGQGASMAGQNLANYNSFGHGFSMPSQGSTAYNQFSQVPLMPTPDLSTYNQFSQVPLMATQDLTTYNQFSQVPLMPTQDLTTYNQFAQGSSIPTQASKKPRYPGSTVADQHEIKYNIFTHGSNMANQGSTKFHKVKAKEEIMTQIVTNANAKNILKGPSVFKNTLRKVCTARIDDIVGTEELNFDDIITRYRLKYPAADDDCALYSKLQETISGGKTMTFEESWEFALQFVSSGRRPAQFPPRTPVAVKAPGRPPGEQPPPRPVGPFASNGKFLQCVGKLGGHVVREMCENLNIDIVVIEDHRVRTLMKKAVNSRVADIVVHMAAPPAHILPHYRKRYPLKTDAELYNKILKTLEEVKSLNSQMIKEFGDSCVIPPKPGSKAARVAAAAVAAGKVPAPASVTAAAKVAGGKWPLRAPFTAPADVTGGEGPAPAPSTAEVKLVGGKWPARAPFAFPAEVAGGKGPAPAARKKPAPAPVAPGKIPTYPKGNKQTHKQQKRQHMQELKSMEGFQMNATFQQALDDEVDAIVTLMKNAFKGLHHEPDKSIVGDVNMSLCITELKKLIAYHTSMRVTNSGVKLVRIYGSPALPKRNTLQDFLAGRRIGCQSIKKSVKAPYFTASFDSFDTVDHLCSLPSVPLPSGNIITHVTFKHMHIVPKKPKKQGHHKALRKKLINNLIEKSQVNLLDKDWPAQEEAEKKARAESMKQIEGTDDVIHVETIINTVDITDDDNNIMNENEANAIENAESGKVEHEFLNEDFQVIDEVRESDNDDNPTGEGKHNDNEVVDDWDVTGDDDWDDITGGDDKKVVDDNKNTTIDNKDAKGGDENAIGNKKSADNDKNAAARDENEAVGVENEAVGDEHKTVDDINEAGAYDDDDIGEEFSGNVEGINIADVDFDDVDEDDLEDY